ncbi:MAG: DUF2849 domain-containing protein [Alphaproteobacteria bacterium]|nr:DUF2849 domain-containing protein [Alphaproteobacteria bacterium]MBE8220762.1 DUF2849 domain-containing protein [Alphaproteobacteria bacterium]
MAQHASKHAAFQALTANRLLDGEVVYFTESGTWVEDFAAALVVESAKAQDLLTRATSGDYEAHIIEPYLFEVADGVPVSVREIIRAKGPTIHSHFTKPFSDKSV